MWDQHRSILRRILDSYFRTMSLNKSVRLILSEEIY